MSRHLLLKATLIRLGTLGPSGTLSYISILYLYYWYLRDQEQKRLSVIKTTWLCWQDGGPSALFHIVLRRDQLLFRYLALSRIITCKPHLPSHYKIQFVFDFHHRVAVWSVCCLIARSWRSVIFAQFTQPPADNIALPPELKTYSIYIYINIVGLKRKLRVLNLPHHQNRHWGDWKPPVKWRARS